MKLLVTLALLYMAFRFNVVNCIKCVQRDDAQTDTAIGNDGSDCSSSDSKCIMYKKTADNRYYRGCTTSTTTCAKLIPGSVAKEQCAECNTNGCNNGKFVTCHDSTDRNNNVLGNTKLCPSGICLMYKTGNDYIRGCAAAKETCQALTSRGGNAITLCAECNSENCNKGTFKTCHEYNRVDTTVPVSPNTPVCPSDTCIMYKKGNNFIWDCTTKTGDCKKLKTDDRTITMCAECNSENCNKGTFKTCHEYNGNNAAVQSNPNPPICPSDTCIMYKQGDNYIRSCVDAKQSCAALTGTAAILCSECAAPDCNNVKFDSACYSYNGPSATHVGNYLVPCSTGSCLAYKEAKTNNYVRTCKTDAIDCIKLETAKTGTNCAVCNGEKCNNGAIQLECHDYSGPSRTDQNNVKTIQCPSGACIMYKETGSGHYKRGCVNTATTCLKLNTAATLCAECSEEKCNKGPFHDPLMCYVNSGKSTTDLGTPTLCESGTCLSYKHVDNFVRACKTSETDIANKNPCTAHNCNNGAFECNCHVYEGDSITDTGEKPGTCKSGKCIMYKDSKTGKYIRNCVEGVKTCSDLTAGKAATQCAECSGEKCNKDEFVPAAACETSPGTTVDCSKCPTNAGTTADCKKCPTKAGSTFSLDVRMAAIALAGFLMIFRSL